MYSRRIHGYLCLSTGDTRFRPCTTATAPPGLRGRRHPQTVLTAPHPPALAQMWPPFARVNRSPYRYRLSFATIPTPLFPPYSFKPIGRLWRGFDDCNRHERRASAVYIGFDKCGPSPVARGRIAAVTRREVTGHVLDVRGGRPHARDRCALTVGCPARAPTERSSRRGCRRFSCCGGGRLPGGPGGACRQPAGSTRGPRRLRPCRRVRGRPPGRATARR